MRMVPRSLLVAVGVLPLLLTGCAPGDQLAIPLDAPASGEPSPAASPAGGASPAATTEGEDGEPVSFPDFPGPALLGCATLLDHVVEENDYSKQWRWEYECRSADPFDRTVEAMNSSGFIHNLDAAGSDRSYRTDNHHYVGDPDGSTWDVDLKAFGPTDELEVTYTVTLDKG